MAELENNNIEQQPQNQNEDQDYIDAINEIKANSVSKDKYDRILAENKKLLKSLTKGEGMEVPAPKKPSIKEAVAPLADRDNQMLSLEFAEQSLAFRQAVMDAGHRDPWLPQGPNAVITQEHYDNAKNMEQVFKHCIEVAQGDSAVFTNEFNRFYKPDPMNYNGRR